MPPRQYSRHTFTTAVRTEGEPQFLTDRVPYRFRQFSDNRQVIAGRGDTLFHIAGRAFQPLPRPAGLWWVIADFQPQPIHDPTIQLAPGQVLVVPSVRTVIEEILNEKRRRVSGIV